MGAGVVLSGRWWRYLLLVEPVQPPSKKATTLEISWAQSIEHPCAKTGSWSWRPMAHVSAWRKPKDRTKEGYCREKYHVHSLTHIDILYVLQCTVNMQSKSGLGG